MRRALMVLATIGIACGEEKPVANDSAAVEANTTLVGADTASVAPAFEVDLPPGEGRPVIEAVDTTVLLLHEPREGAPVAGVMSTRPGERLNYDSTRFQTMTPSLSRALRAATVRGRDLGEVRQLTREEYYSGAFPDTTLQVRPSETIEFLQHRAEGTCFVRIRGRVVDAEQCPVFDTTTFTPAADPRTLWWIYAKGLNVSGWLLLTDTTAKVVNRTF